MEMQENNNIEFNGPAPTSTTNVLNCGLKLVGIQYPGFVNDIDKAIETLGGIKDIETATSNPKKNLELRFRPSNYYCKPCISEKDTKPNILLKVKTKKIEKNGQVAKEVLDYDVLGITALSFKFNKLCDFQYLPLVPKENVEIEDELEYVYNKIIPDKLPNGDWIFNEESEHMQLYFPPSSFSKHNSSNNQLYFDRSKFYEGRFTPEYYKKFKEQELLQKMYKKDIGKSILSNRAFFCSFEDDIPQGPSQSSLENLSVKYTSNGAVLKVEECFEKRPIWSKQALLYTSGVVTEQMRHILPTVAYHCVSGPWRIMWIKFGYDPRKNPSAKIYQTFDYRIRSKGGFKLKVKPKRCYASNPIYTDNDNKKFSLQDESHLKSRSQVNENSFSLKPNMIPSARQMFYQYCDVQLPEIQAMFARLPPILPGTKCHPKNGWLPSGFTEQCREIANKYIGKQVQIEIRKEKEYVEMPVQKENVEHEHDEVEHDEQSDPDEYFEISDTSSSTSDSEGETNVEASKQDDSENEIDFETVEEINKLLEAVPLKSGTPKDLFAPGSSKI